MLNIAALNLSEATRLNATAGTEGKALKPYDAAEGKPKRGVQGREERGDVNSLLRLAENQLARFTKSSLQPASVIHKEPTGLEKWQRNFNIRAGDSDRNDPVIFEHLMSRINEEKLLVFFHWLRGRQGLQSRADDFQKLLCEDRSHLLKPLNEIWLQNKVHPTEVLNMVRSWEGGIEQWLRYTELYSKAFGVDSFSVEEAVKQLTMNSNSLDKAYGVCFERVHDEDLQSLARLAGNPISSLD